MLKQTGFRKLSNYGEHPRVVLKVTINKLTREDQHRIMILICCITQLKWQNTKSIYSVSGISDISLAKEIAAHMN